MSAEDWTWRDLGWPQVAVVFIVAAALVASCFAPNAGCSVRITDSPTTTTTEVVR